MKSRKLRKSKVSRRRTRGRLRAYALLAATLLIAGVWTVNWFRSFCFSVRFLTTIEDSRQGYDFHPGIDNMWLGFCNFYVATTRHCVGFGRELIPEWSDIHSAGDYPCLTFNSRRSNRYPYSVIEFTDSSNWHVGGLGICHSDAYPSGGGVTPPPYDLSEFSIPYWLVVIIIAVLWRRRWRRWRIQCCIEQGGCPECGYDLRGSPPVGLLVACPECGEATIAPDAEIELIDMPVPHATCIMSRA